MDNLKIVMPEDYLMHYGVEGQKWGVRRWQNEDGSLTEAGRKHYGRLGRAEQAARDSSRYADLRKGTIRTGAGIKTAVGSAIGGVKGIVTGGIMSQFTGASLGASILKSGVLGLGIGAAATLAGVGMQYLGAHTLKKYSEMKISELKKKQNVGGKL